MTQVVDRGVGIESKDMSKLFTTFNNSKLANFSTQGIGLGLSTSKELCQSLGGAISMDSEKDIGTEITFSIHVRDAVAPLQAEDLKHQLSSFRQEFGDLLIPKNASEQKEELTDQQLLLVKERNS